VSECLNLAKDAGYKEAKLDTLPHMVSAIKMYESFGFVECEKYYETPLEKTKFMRADLQYEDQG
jgi:ribosomal protein S18 acetylase RimI-like enzyme